MDDAYKELSTAIVIQAVNDYRKALKTLKGDLSDRKKLNAARSTKRECEQFFRSGWFATLTAINPQFLIDKIKSEV